MAPSDGADPAHTDPARTDPARTDLADRIGQVLALGPDQPAVQFEGRWTTWGDLASVAEGLAAQVADRGLAQGTPIGLVLRNRPAMVGAMLGTLLARCCIVTVNPSQGDDGLAADLAGLGLPVVVATGDDWSRPGVVEAAAAAGAVGIEVGTPDGGPAGAWPVVGLEVGGRGPFRAPQPGVAVEMLTSGTTGPPKRVPLAAAAFERTISAAGAHYSSSGAAAPLRLRRSVAIVSSPFVHMSGLFRTLLNVCEGRRIALLERFRVDDVVALVREHQPRAVSLVPTALRMVMEADVPPDAFASVQVVTSGTAKLPVDLQVAFEQRYDVAVLPSYGATEFAGGVAGWTLALHREWADAKRGSVGRPQAGRQVRVTEIDAPDGEPRPLVPGARGRIEVRSAGGPWVRTTDVGRVDEDGFVWIDGRVDDVIVRGGFKITPAVVVDALRAHPAVRDAGVTGLEDERLGAVPVAAVELEDGVAVGPADLLDHLRATLPRYQVPAQLRIVDELPRTPSLKVSQPGVRALFDGATAVDAGARP